MVFFILILSSCQKYALFDSGDKVTAEFNLEDFTTLEIEDVFNLTLVSDTINKLIVTTGENLLDNISYEITDHVLYLYNYNKFRWTREYDRVDLTLHTNNLEKIHIREPSNIKSEGIYKAEKLSIIGWSMVNQLNMIVDLDFLAINMGKSNSGEYKVSGYANRYHVSGWGSSFIYTHELISNEVHVRQRSIGDVYVYALDKLSIDIETSGNVYYKGNPSLLDSTITGSGGLFRIND